MPAEDTRLARPAVADATEASLDAILGAALDRLTRAGLRRTLRPVRRVRPGVVALEGREVVDFASNDYLGLAADDRLRQAAAAALAGEGVGAAAARLIAGDHPLHETLERALAALKRTEAALLFPTGYAANTGVIPALVGRRDGIYADALNHASLIDGCRLSGAEVRTFRHNDADALGALLDADRGRFRRRLVVIDAVFSMDGDLAPLDRLAPLARAAGAWLYIDDAHGTGVLGREGRGSTEHWGVEGQIEIVMGTLGKALGTMGAFVCGSRTLIDYLLHRARTFVFTTGTPPALAAAALAAIEAVNTEPWRRDRLRANARRLRSGLAAQGYAFGAVSRLPAAPTGSAVGAPPPHTPVGPPDGHIVPIIVGDSERAVRLGASLLEHGFLVGAVRPPTVPVGSARLRLSVSAAHTNAQIDGLVAALGELGPGGD